MKALKKLVFRYRNLLAGGPLIFAFFSTKWAWENDWGIWTLAVLLCASGVWLRAWATSHCSYGQGRRKELAMTGPYAYVRNPLYIGNLAAIAGATIASELVWLLPVTTVWAFIVYVVTVAHEENRLSEKYGEAFMEYKARVPAWIPDFGKLLAAENRFARTFLRQCTVFWVLLPFVIKELILDFWQHH